MNYAVLKEGQEPKPWLLFSIGDSGLLRTRIDAFENRRAAVIFGEILAGRDGKVEVRK